MLSKPIEREDVETAEALAEVIKDALIRTDDVKVAYLCQHESGRIGVRMQDGRTFVMVIQKWA